MWIVVSYLWAINALTLLAFGWDKLRAKRRKRRVPERRLLWLALLGGSPAAILGRFVFSHKSRKRRFSALLFGIAAVQIGLFALLVTDRFAGLP